MGSSGDAELLFDFQFENECDLNETSPRYLWSPICACFNICHFSPQLFLSQGNYIPFLKSLLLFVAYRVMTREHPCSSRTSPLFIHYSKYPKQLNFNSEQISLINEGFILGFHQATKTKIISFKVLQNTDQISCNLEMTRDNYEVML